MCVVANACTSRCRVRWRGATPTSSLTQRLGIAAYSGTASGAAAAHSGAAFPPGMTAARCREAPRAPLALFSLVRLLSTGGPPAAGGAAGRTRSTPAPAAAAGSTAAGRTTFTPCGAGTAAVVAAGAPLRMLVDADKSAGASDAVAMRRRRPVALIAPLAVAGIQLAAPAAAFATSTPGLPTMTPLTTLTTLTTLPAARPVALRTELVLLERDS